MKTKRHFFVMVTFSIALLLVFASPGLAGKAGFDKKEIRIAQWGPQTGPAAPWGSVARGSAILFNLVNEEGGIHGRKIKYFIRDDQYNPALCKAAVKELVQKREQARKEKDFALADEIRRQLDSKGFSVKDLPGGKQELYRN